MATDEQSATAASPTHAGQQIDSHAESHSSQTEIGDEPSTEQQQQRGQNESHLDDDAVAEPDDSEQAALPAASTSPAPAMSPKPNPEPAALCGVCQKQLPKYKCPRCYLPYCSVPCNKIHRENHPEPQPPKLAPKATPTQAPVEPFDPSNPFRALETSEKLKLLFQKYPSLPSQLLEIHAATLPPTEGQGTKAIPSSLMQGVPKRDNWNHDMGIKNGKEALRKARRANGEAGDAIREYSELIRQIMNDTGAKEMATLLQQQAAEEDNKLIERLIADESRR